MAKLTFWITNLPLAFFNGCRKLCAKKAQRDICINISTKFRIIIIDENICFIKNLGTTMIKYIILKKKFNKHEKNNNNKITYTVMKKMTYTVIKK